MNNEQQTKYKGIDSRTVKCGCDDPDCIESGISFDGDNEVTYLRFHYLEYVEGTTILTQKTKIMVLNKENTSQLINELKNLTFK